MRIIYFITNILDQNKQDVVLDTVFSINTENPLRMVFYSQILYLSLSPTEKYFHIYGKNVFSHIFKLVNELLGVVQMELPIFNDLIIFEPDCVPKKP